MILDALIIGGGPAGSTTAWLLAQAGWNVAIVEKKAFPRQKVCGEFISATNLPLLHKLGLLDFYLTHAGPEITRVGLFARDTLLISSMPPANSSSNHWGRALGRESLDSLLLDKARRAGAIVWQPWHFKTLQRDKNTMISTIASNDKIKHICARLVIMANGSWEPGTHSFNKYPHQPSDLLAFKAHFRQCELAPDLMPLLAFPGGYGGLVHSEGGQVTLSCCIRRDILLTARQHSPGLQAGEAVLHHIKASCLGVHQVFSQARRDENWLSIGPIRPGIHKRYAEGIFFVGNSAGEAHPVIAEGISMAMQSAWLLSQLLLDHQNKIQSGKHLDEAGQDYTQQWNEHFASRIHAAALFAQLTMRPWTLAMILPILNCFPGLLTFAAKWSGKIKQVIPASKL
jgi:flavin-dependent dehydrogenase